MNVLLIPYLFLLISSSYLLTADPRDTEVWEPIPDRLVSSAVTTPPPASAVVLFQAGWQLGHWRQAAAESAPALWEVKADSFVVVPGTGNIATRSEFADFHLHIEWRVPVDAVGLGQNRGNSGVFLAERYEIQILDCNDNRTYSNGQAASVYKQSIPLYNACAEEGEWQSYDILFRAPKFDSHSQELVDPAYVTVIHNGVVVQNQVSIKGTTIFDGQPRYEHHGPATIILQDHYDLPSPGVEFRNIWLLPLVPSRGLGEN